jgi:hypothetical protein
MYPAVGSNGITACVALLYILYARQQKIQQNGKTVSCLNLLNKNLSMMMGFYICTTQYPLHAI